MNRPESHSRNGRDNHMEFQRHHRKPSGLLITGATGMVGSYIVAEMLRRQVAAANPGTGSCCELVAVARPKGRLSAAQRIDSILSKFENHWHCDLPRPVVLEGDLLKEGLGLSQADTKRVRKSCDQVLHSAASLSFAPASEDPNNEPYRTNVQGTENLITLCQAAGIESMHHISTAYVCGIRSGRVLESKADVGQKFANDYERSKTIAETMVGDAFGSKQLTAYRPSIVIDRTGLAPVSGDRTIYGAYSMYQMLASRFGLPEHGVWFRNLGFAGQERKNLVDVDWIARAVATILFDPRHHGVTHHLTAQEGTSIETLDQAFRISTEKWLGQRKTLTRNDSAPKQSMTETMKAEIDQMAAPFVRTFLPYFRDDPTFDRSNIDRVVATTDLEQSPAIGQQELLDMIANWSAPIALRKNPTALPKKPVASGKTLPRRVAETSTTDTGHGSPPQPVVSNAAAVSQDIENDDVVICGYAVRLPGGVNNVEDFETLLFEGRSAIQTMPNDRLDRSLYFDTRRGIPGKTYTEKGGCVDQKPLSKKVEKRIRKLGDFDLTHRQFAQVAMAAFRSTFGVDSLEKIKSVDATRAGVFVGHSGGTATGGPLAMATLAEAASCLMDQTQIGAALDAESKQRIIAEMTDAIRAKRPKRSDDGGPELNAYSAASLAAKLTGMRGRREVIDAACSSSLIALQHAALSITQDRMDIALVGGATFNNVDNLALFSQSGACSDSDSHPFDSRASGLISSEGYVGVVLMRRSVAAKLKLPILAVVQGVGVASDGKGKGLWAPRTEGQQLAMTRASQSIEAPLQVDYLECHATSTQVGDATELESLTTLLNQNPASEKRDSPSSSHSQKLLIGSVKSNLGHLLEAAGLVGMVKCLLAMKRGVIPPSINFSEPTELYDWNDSPVQVVARKTDWPTKSNQNKQTHSPRVAGVNAFGIGGLNAHAVIAEDSIRTNPSPRRQRTHNQFVPVAIVGRGVVLPGCDSVESLQRLLRSGRTEIDQAPDGRWLNSPIDASKRVGIGEGSFQVPHCRGGYVRGFQFDAQSYRIPPKLVRNANPAQLMLIDAVRQSLEEFDQNREGGFDPKSMSVDRQRVGVSVGTIFGGQFSNELQVGLRMPELEKHLAHAAGDLGLAPSDLDSMLNQYRDAVLRRYPALLDETGGFTASTLASAIARIFNLMGGAYAVDSEEASGGLAMLSGIERLQASDVDLIICGATHRAMDLVTFEQLYRKGQLASGQVPSDCPKDGSQIFPGEGVASILLQRLDDAVQQGRKILGVIDEIGERWTDDVPGSRRKGFEQSEQHDSYTAHQLVSQIGHLGGAQGLVRTIAATLGQKRSTTIEETADDGYQIRYQVRSITETIPTHDSQPQSDVLMSSKSSPKMTNLRRDTVASIAPRTASTVDGRGLSQTSLIPVRLEANSYEELGDALNQLASDSGSAKFGINSHRAVVTQFSDVSDSGRYQAGIVGESTDQIRKLAADLLAGPFRDRKTTATKRGLSWIRFPSKRSRTAWLFPGQGSQYSDVPNVMAKDSGATEFLNRFDRQLQSMGLEPVTPRLHDPDRMLGRDVWWTQLWVLAVGSMMADSLLRRGHRPDVVLGHSFGECTAAWSAGVMSTEQAIAFAKYRSDAVVTVAREEGELLSVRASPTAIKAALQTHGLRYHITHHNAPQQTVIAGAADVIILAKKALAAAGFASVVIPVPAAFHTPGMAPARDVLAAKFENQSLRWPRFGYLSAISNRYLAEPRDVLNNLIDQLTHPVCFSPAIDRLAADGCGLMVEVGPSDVLTRLASATTDGRVICLSTDDPSRNHDAQNLLIDLAMEAFAPNHPATGSVIPTPSSVRDSDATASPAPVHKRSFAVVDVTKRKRTENDSVSDPETEKPHQDTSIDSLAPVRFSAVESEPVKSGAVTSGAVTSGPGPGNAAAELARIAETSPTANAGLRESAKSFLFDLVVDLTGYDPDIIEFDADLEGELGVDSIKKAQLIGEIVQWGNLSVDLQSMRLAQFVSLDDILQLIPADPPCQDSSGASPSNDTEQQHGNEAALHAGASDSDAKAAATNPDIAASLQRMIIDLVVDQTGYDEDIIDMEADLEGELGVDSIKRAQLLGELETTYQLQSLRDQNLRLSDFPTLASIHAYVLNHLQTGSATSGPASLLTDTLLTDTLSTSAEKKKHFVDDERSELDPAPNGSLGRIKANEFDEAPATGTHRFVMRMRQAARLPGMPDKPRFYGPALVIGSNTIAKEITRRLKREGMAVSQIKTKRPIDDIDGVLSELWKDGLSRHVFITTPHDKDASWKTTDAETLASRKESSLGIPYRVCQRWMQQAIDEDVMKHASLVSVVNGSGNFGFDPSADLQKSSAESGGIAGLTKAMLIESWMRGYRDTPMLVIDALPNRSVEQVVDGIWNELAVPSYEEEVAVAGPQRLATCARYLPIKPTAKPNQITEGGVWIVAGGGRGITAMTAMELAKRHGLKLHLLGMAKAETIDPATRIAAQEDRAALRRETMARVQSQGENPVKHWRNYEKAIEIDQTLDACRRLGIAAVYHSVDVSNANEVETLIQQIRDTDGPIRGVIQGAGSGQDARFDRKRPDKVQQCLQAKIDGCAALASATVCDPLEFFIGFGSISGRFGANGHTDYSAANDMLAKMVGRLGVERPETRCFTFHWHAWGDIGMATKPEAKLALDMIGMEFMPASEGLQHFLNEVELGGDEPEILITDRRYVRKFFPDDGMQKSTSGRRTHAPMLDPTEQGIDQLDWNEHSFKVTLDPTRDLFLDQHRVGDRPTLPFVMAIEMMAEAASVSAARSGQPDRVIACRNVQAVYPLKCLTDDAFAIELLRDADQSSKEIGQPSSWRLVSDLRRRDGRLVEARRTHFTAEFMLGQTSTLLCQSDNAEFAIDSLETISQEPIEYMGTDAPIYHGPSLQTLRCIGFGSTPLDGIDRPCAVGSIVAPSPAQLAGESRPLAGWVLCPATMDAVLYAAGMLAYRVGRRPSLPVRFDRIQFGRLPQPGEPLRVTVVWKQDHFSGGEMIASLVGLNQDPILQLEGYRVGWMG